MAIRHLQMGGPLAACLLFASVVDFASAEVIADSVADFGGTQGEHGWYYGYYDKTTDPNHGFDLNDFVLMPTYLQQSELWEWVTGPAWAVHPGTLFTELWANGGHGNGLVTSGGRQPEEQFADRRWQSDYDGGVTISGSLAKLDPNAASNGVAGRIYLNGEPVWWQYISGSDTSGVSYHLDLVVHTGDIVDFQLDPWNAIDWADSSLFTVRIVPIPEPSTLSLLVGGVLAMAACRRRMLTVRWNALRSSHNSPSKGTLGSPAVNHAGASRSTKQGLT